MIDLLMDERAIHLKLCAIARAMDCREWTQLTEILTEDVTGDLGDVIAINGREEFLATLRKYLGNCGPTQHLLGNLVVSIDGDAAKSTCYVRDIHQGGDGRDHLFLSTAGEYRDCWKRTPKGWRLCHRTKVNFLLTGSLEALGIRN